MDRGRAQALPARLAEARQGARAFWFSHHMALFLNRGCRAVFPLARATRRRARTPDASVPWPARDSISFPGALLGCPAVDIARAPPRPTLRCPRHTQVAPTGARARLVAPSMTARRQAVPLPASRSRYNTALWNFFFPSRDAPRRGPRRPPSALPPLTLSFPPLALVTPSSPSTMSPLSASCSFRQGDWRGISRHSCSRARRRKSRRTRKSTSSARTT